MPDSGMSSGTDVAANESEPPATPAQDTLPAPGATDQVASLGDSAEIRTEAAGYTTALLFRAGYPNHVILATDSAVPEDAPTGDAVWELGEVTGSTRIVSSGTPDDIKSGIGADLLEKCGGLLTTRVVSSDMTHMHFALTCGAQAPSLTQYLVLPREAGGSYLLALMGRPGDGMAGSIAEAVYSTAVGG